MKPVLSTFLAIALLAGTVSRCGALKADSPARAPKGISVCFGGTPSWSPSNWPGQRPAVEAMAARLKGLGATSAEDSVPWSGLEGEAEGRWRWIGCDGIAQAYGKVGLRWTPFLVAGPGYATPDWFKKTDYSVCARCLEHNEDSAIQSIWNPYLSRWVDRYLGEFAKRYGKTGIVESVLLGISGSYGEAIMPAGGGGWTESHHAHPGYWCGDRYALADYRDFLRRKYGQVSALNAAWKSSHLTFQEIRPTLPEKAASDRAWLDQMTWYQESMNRWTDRWMAIARERFPHTPSYLRTGGNGDREQGSNFSAQCKIAAKYRAGVRITHDGVDYPAGFVMTRWAATAGKHYGAYYSFEPPAPRDERGIRAQLYNAIASGASQLRVDQGSVADTENRARAFLSQYRFLRLAKPVVEAAAFLPRTSQMLHRDDFAEKARLLRDITDFDIVDEDLIRDGALRHYKALILLSGNVVENEDLKRIDAWVHSGGKLIACDFGEIRTVEGDTSLYNKWFGGLGSVLNYTKAIGRGEAFFDGRGWDQKDSFFSVVRIALSGIPGRIEPDGEIDGVFATVLKDAVLYLNTTGKPVMKTLRPANGKIRKITIPAGAIYEEKL